MWYRFQVLTGSDSGTSVAAFLVEDGLRNSAVLMLLGFLTCLVAGSPWGCQSKARNTGSGGSNGTSAGGTGVQTGTGAAAGDASASTGLGGAAGDASTSTGAAGADPVGECTPHEVRCDGLVPQRCSELGQWVATQAACAVACYQGECVACAAEDRECRDGAVQECVDGNWSTVSTCANACEDETCVDACTEGRFQCNGSRLLQQCNGGEYVDHTECEFVCSNGECTGECMPDARRCDPDAENASQSCNAQGQWDASQSCDESGTFCVLGDCKPCKPGTKRCSDVGPQLCSDAGEWVNQGACTSPNAVCFEGDCVPCTPGEKRCTDSAVEQCLADGSGFEVVQTCSGETPACIESTKSCGKCSEGSRQCLSDQVQTCDDKGAWVTTETCSGATPQCVDSKCVQCDPAVNERRCQSSTSAQGCSANGSWGASESCSGALPICRDDLNFACGCEEGERRCKNSTVPEVCQGGEWVAQASCSGVLNYCLPETGRCVDCVPGTTQCQSGVAHECSIQGSWQSLNSCAGPGINCGGCDLGEDCGMDADCDSGVCVNGTCAVCKPGARTCQGNTPQLCSASGSWSAQTPCSGNTPQCLPSTGQCVQCLSGSRSCGNCNLGTQTCSNNTWGTCTGAPNLQTNNQHCGTCFNACGSGQCVSGSCRAPNGSACGSDDDCVSGDCSTFYKDEDGDGFGAASSGSSKLCGQTPPSGSWVANNLDCCDSDNEANPNYSGGPRDDAPVGCGTYDWNCDGDETKSIAAPGSQGCLAFKTKETCPFSAFDNDTACGQEGTADLCGWDGSTCVNARGALQTQTCQ